MQDLGRKMAAFLHKSSLNEARGATGGERARPGPSNAHGLTPAWSMPMAHQQSDTLFQETPSRVVVHLKLSTHVHNLLKAVLSLEGSTMQAYFAAQAEAKIARASRQPRASTAPTPSAPSSSAVL